MSDCYNIKPWKCTHLTVCVALKRLAAQAPYLIHHSTKTPDVTSRGVLPEIQSLGKKNKTPNILLSPLL